MCTFVSVLLLDIFYSVGLGCLVVVLFITSCDIKLVVLLQCRVELQAVLLLSRVSQTRPPRHNDAPHAPLRFHYYSSAATPRHVQNDAN